MALTITYDKKIATNKSLGASLARGKKLAVGTIAFATYATGGLSVDFGALNVDFVQFESPASGYLFAFDHTNETVKVFQSVGSDTAAAFSELPSDTALASWSAVKFFAIGD